MPWITAELTATYSTTPGPCGANCHLATLIMMGTQANTTNAGTELKSLCHSL